jgi:hypothetical protein
MGFLTRDINNVRNRFRHVERDVGRTGRMIMRGARREWHHAGDYARGILKDPHAAMDAGLRIYHGVGNIVTGKDRSYESARDNFVQVGKDFRKIKERGRKSRLSGETMGQAAMGGLRDTGAIRRAEHYARRRLPAMGRRTDEMRKVINRRNVDRFRRALGKRFSPPASTKRAGGSNQRYAGALGSYVGPRY